jgi:hypothetical protein
LSVLSFIYTKKINYNMADITSQFSGLPIEDLIVSPLVGMAKGQAQLNDVTWRYISEVAFTKDKDGNTTARSLDVQMNRVMTNPEDGSQSIQKIYTQVPMLPLVPLPSLAITSADIEFTMEVKTSEVDKSSTDTEASFQASASGGFWGMKYSVSMAGKVSTHKENTRSTDNSAKYNVKVHAEQLPATEGMLKLSDYLTQMLEPSLIPLTQDPQK